MDFSVLISFATMLYCYVFFGLSPETAAQVFFGGVGRGIMFLIGGCLAIDVRVLLLGWGFRELGLRMGAALLLASAARSVGRMLGARSVRPLLPPRVVFPAAALAYGITTLEKGTDGWNASVVVFSMVIGGLCGLAGACFLFDVCLAAFLAARCSVRQHERVNWSSFCGNTLTVKITGGVLHWLLWPPA